MTITLALLAVLASQEDPSLKILKDAMAQEGDPAALQRALAAVGEDLKTRPKAEKAHYARGWILSRLNRLEEAVAAYDEASRLSPTFADAFYNAGVVMSRLKRNAEASARYDAAAAADPAHVDALYNAGQSYYDQKNFRASVDRWSKARVLNPKDFDIVKKVLQSQNALGDTAGAAQTRHALLELRRESTNPKIKNLKAYVFEQFDVGKAHVFAYEYFDLQGDLYYVYRFQVTDAADRAAGSINLESSAVLREAGTPYVLGVDKGKEHITTTTAFKTLPAVAEIKPAVLKLIETHFPELVKP